LCSAHLSFASVRHQCGLIALSFMPRSDIVVPMSWDIGQPQCVICHHLLIKITKTNNPCERKKKTIYYIVVGQCHIIFAPQCHTSAIPCQATSTFQTIYSKQAILQIYILFFNFKSINTSLLKTIWLKQTC